MATILDGQPLNGWIGTVEHVNANIVRIFDVDIVQCRIAVVDCNAPLCMLDSEEIDDTTTTATGGVELDAFVGGRIP